MRILVLTSEAVSADELRDAVGSEADDAEILVVAPALQDSPVRFWLSDVDGAIERADVKQRESVRRLSNAGVDAKGDTGEADPVVAIEDGLRTFDADRIVVFRHRDRELAYREDELLADLEQRFGLPVRTRVLGAAS
jgi:hypothetical protein